MKQCRCDDAEVASLKRSRDKAVVKQQLVGGSQAGNWQCTFLEAFTHSFIFLRERPTTIVRMTC